MELGAAITVGLLVAVIVAVFAVKLPLQQAIWEVLATDLKSSDPARRRTARVSLVVAIVVPVVGIALMVIYGS
jgi:hypothetical protein